MEKEKMYKLICISTALMLRHLKEYEKYKRPYDRRNFENYKRQVVYMLEMNGFNTQLNDDSNEKD